MSYVLSLSYGKDSMACLGAIKELGLPLDRIITVDVMASSSLYPDDSSFRWNCLQNGIQLRLFPP